MAPKSMSASQIRFMDNEGVEAFVSTEIFLPNSYSAFRQKPGGLRQKIKSIKSSQVSLKVEYDLEALALKHGWRRI